MRHSTLHPRRVPHPRITVSTILGVIAISAAAPQLLGGLASAGAGPIVLPWPRCAPLCTHAPARGPRVTAIYLSTQQSHGRPVVTVDAFAAGIRARSVTGQLCYEAHHLPREPGCEIAAITHGRRVGAGVWWLRFKTSVYERYQISTSNSHALVRTYWFGVSVPVGDSSAEGSRQGTFRLGSS